MAFAPFPPPAYLSDGARTEGEMKTAFENWLLATKQTSGHGQCRLTRTSPTQVWLTPYEGRRVLLNDKAYELPVGGLTITNAGLLASTAYLAALHDDAGTVSLKLYYLAAPPGAIRKVDPDSGVSMVSFDNGATVSRATTVVGIVVTDAAAQFPTFGVCSLFGRALKMAGPTLVEMSGGSATYLGVLGASVAVFAGDLVQCAGALVVQTQAGVGALVVATGKVGTTAFNSAVENIPINNQGTLNVTWPAAAQFDGALYVELGFSVFGGEPITLRASSYLYTTRVA